LTEDPFLALLDERESEQSEDPPAPKPPKRVPKKVTKKVSKAKSKKSDQSGTIGRTTAKNIAFGSDIKLLQEQLAAMRTEINQLKNNNNGKLDKYIIKAIEFCVHTTESAYRSMWRRLPKSPSKDQVKIARDYIEEKKNEMS